MNLKKELVKEKIFLILSFICVVLTFIGAFMVITHKLDNAGYAVIPMLFSLVFSMLNRNSKKAIEENRK